jgi:hypothetical protein
MIVRFLPLIIFLALLVGCTEDPLFPKNPITVQVTNLPPLTSNAHYKLWLSYPRDVVRAGDEGDYEYISAGAFRIDAPGTMTGLDGGPGTFAIPEGINPELIAGALLSVERTGGVDSVPGARMLGGIFVRAIGSRSTQLTLRGSAAFGSALDFVFDTSLTQPPRTFLLETPTTREIDDYAQGIWFVTSDLRDSSLPLPPQPLISTNKLWVYESWLVHRDSTGNTEYISLGRFNDPAEPDDNGPGPGAGPLPDSAFALPGEDFVESAHQRQLNDGTYGVVVALSPVGIPLDRPLVTLLYRDTIDKGVAARLPMTLVRAATVPVIDVNLKP